MQGTAMRSNVLANRNTIATTVGEQIMEDLLSVDLRVGNPIWYTIYTNAGVYVYDRFPPFNGSNAPAATYPVTGVGTFTANYVITLNTPNQSISQVDLQLFLNGNRVPFRFFGHKIIPH
jgi:hypothetical protein